MLKGLKYKRRYRFGRFIVIYVLQLFILVEFSDGRSRERFLLMVLGFSSSITLCGVMCGVLAFLYISFTFLHYHVCVVCN